VNGFEPLIRDTPFDGLGNPFKIDANRREHVLVWFSGDYWGTSGRKFGVGQPRSCIGARERETVSSGGVRRAPRSWPRDIVDQTRTLTNPGADATETAGRSKSNRRPTWARWGALAVLAEPDRTLRPSLLRSGVAAKSRVRPRIHPTDGSTRGHWRRRTR